MVTSLKIKLLAPSAACGLLALTLTACQKDTSAPVVEDKVIEVGSPKIPTNIFGYSNASAPYVFAVQRGAIPYGQARNNSSPLIGMVTGSQSASGFSTAGYTSPCGVTSDPNFCNFDKGTGSVFYIIPLQSTVTPKKILRVTFNGSFINLPPVGTAWFTYNKATNSWSAQNGASAFAQWSQVTSLPPSGC